MTLSSRILAVLVAAVALIAFSGATAEAKAQPHAAAVAKTYTVTFQVDRDVPSSWSRQAPLVWENGTALNITRGTCVGALCVHVHTDAGGTPCSPGNGCAGNWGATFPDLHSEQCEVWLPNTVAANYGRDVQWSMFAHEFGHCLGLPHADGTSWMANDPYSIMWPQTQIYQPTMNPDAGDIAAVNSLWP